MLTLINDTQLQGQPVSAIRGGRFRLGFSRFQVSGGEASLRILESAVSIADLKGLPSNRLESLKGDRTGQFSIRINQQWRICFEWPANANGPSNVEIVDDH